MVRKSKQQENIFTPSGHQVDRDLMKVSVKVSPSLQALIANQIDLIEMLEGKAAKNPVLVEQHRVEVLQVEEEIASAFSNYLQKKEKAREQRLKKKQLVNEGKSLSDGEDSGKAMVEEQPVVQRQMRNQGDTAVPFEIEGGTGGGIYTDKPVLDRKEVGEPVPDTADRLLEYDMHFDIEPASHGPGLPSSRYVNANRSAVATGGVDVRRVALGASIRALQSFLGRELSEDEIKFLETQVDNNLK
ncbi:hypothetical protein [Desulfallas thermosapovorans]|uniref:Uncharacterized protein n=1 Tax=Desulfallas thermosapovorans DSM 6562 TaxID=1121431 RepID=A0A5S4ZPK5_9FIRM|nr:hypothetical protein [Desulfallas thermosapovorans]TYO94739.1 hypothetical protein LX24_02208 [Desulfallas thermosapovorans DSM 6562]